MCWPSYSFFTVKLCWAAKINAASSFLLLKMVSLDYQRGIKHSQHFHHYHCCHQRSQLLLNVFVLVELHPLKHLTLVWVYLVLFDSRYYICNQSFITKNLHFDFFRSSRSNNRCLINRSLERKLNSAIVLYH